MVNETRNERGREGGNLLNQPVKNTQPVITPAINNLTLSEAKLNTKISYVIAGVNNGFNIMPTKAGSKQPDWLRAKASTYKASVDKLKLAYSQHPEYGYGLLTGKQLGGFYLTCIDIDIDTAECKERISKELEELLSKHEIKYQKEITKSGRIHYYILLDKTSDKIESISKLPYSGTCIKYKDNQEIKGEIELFTKNKFVVVYDGIINDNKPFFVDKPTINDYRKFGAFLDDYLSKFKNKEIKEPEKTSIQFSEIVEAYKIIRKHHIVNGWEIDKVFSAYCIRENIPDEEAIKGFKDIYGAEYDEKITTDLLSRTKKKDLNLLPNLGSVYYHINTALNSGAKLEDNERELLEAVLESSGYSDYELPEYLLNAEDVILDNSDKIPNKNGGWYYKESYFIEQIDEVEEIRKVIYVNIITSEKNGIYKEHSFDGKIKEIGLKADIIRPVKEDEEVYEFLLNNKIVYRPKSNSSATPDDDVKGIANAVKKYSYSFDYNLYKRYLTLKIRNYIKEHGEPIPCVIGKQTGWSEDLKFFYHYGLDDAYHELHKDHTLYKRSKNKIKDKDKQHELVKEILKEGKLLGVLLVASVSSLFIKPFNIPGITVIIAGNSGAGKTTSSLIATSLFYYSDDVLINAQTSKVGLELTISNLNSLPVLIDEGALAGFNLSLSDLVFMVNSGTGKTRGKKDLTVDFKELKSNVFWTTETTDIDNLRRTGAFRRLLYIVVKSWEDFTNLFRPEERINEKYAGCGIDYIQYLIKHKEDIEKVFKEETYSFSSKYREITTIGLNLYSGLILLEAYYNTKFENLRKTIDKVLDDAKALFIENKENVVEKLKEFLNEWQHIHFHILHPDGKIERAKQNAWGEYDIGTETYYITTDGWSEIMSKITKEKKLVKKELEEAGILEYKSHRHKATQSIAKTYIIKFESENEKKNDKPIIDEEPVEF